MRISLATIGDSANVRENLLNVLGAGVTQIYKGDYPSRPDVVLACMIEAAPEDGPGPHHVGVTLINAQSKEQVFEATAQLNLGPAEQGQASSDVSLPTYVPFVVRLVLAELPTPGRYEIHINAAEADHVVLPFAAWRGKPGGDVLPSLT